MKNTWKLHNKGPQLAGMFEPRPFCCKATVLPIVPLFCQLCFFIYFLRTSCSTFVALFIVTFNVVESPSSSNYRNSYEQLSFYKLPPHPHPSFKLIIWRGKKHNLLNHKEWCFLILTLETPSINVKQALQKQHNINN